MKKRYRIIRTRMVLGTLALLAAAGGAYYATHHGAKKSHSKKQIPTVSLGVPKLEKTARGPRAEYAVLFDTQHPKGQVLHSLHGTKPRPPASLSKYLLALLAYEDMEKGTLSASDKVTITKEATHVAPVKAGLVAGQEISVADLLRLTYVFSANDAAEALAQHLGGGSRQGYLERVAARSRELGLTSVNFKTASGLPYYSNYAKKTGRVENIASFPDLIKVRRLLEQYPGFQRLSQRRTYTMRGRVFGSHSKLNCFENIDIKTGTTRGAGSSLIATWKASSTQMLHIGLGGFPSAASRDKRAAELFIELRRKMGNPVEASEVRPGKSCQRFTQAFKASMR